MGNKPSRKTFRIRFNKLINTLRQEIMSGKRQVGDYLPSEMALAEQFQLSKNSVRKALEVLVDEGLIVKKPWKGSVVTRPAADGAVTVKFGYHVTMANEANIFQLLQDFQQQHPHIRVQTVALPQDGFYQASKELIDNDMIDVISMNVNNFRNYVENESVDILEPLPGNASLYPFASEPFRYQGEQYVQPLIHSPVILCYNLNHLQELQLPEPDSSWTWDRLIDVAEQLTRNSGNGHRYGFYFHPLSANRWPIFLLQNASQFQRDEKGKYHLCGTPMMEGLRRCRDLIQKKDIFPGFLSESEADAEALFLQEKVSMIMTTYFNLNHLREAKFPFDISPVPYLKTPATLFLVIGLAINRRSNQKEAARTLVEFMLSQQTQMTIRKDTYSIPSLPAAAEWVGSKQEETLYRPERFHLYREIIPTFRHFTDLNISSQNLNVLNREVKLFWSQMEDEQDFCRRMETLL